MGEKRVTQYIRTPLNFAYAQRSINEKDIFLDLIVSGKRSNPTIEVVPKVKGKDEKTTIKVYKVDLTKYLETKASLGISITNNTIPIYPKTNRFGRYIESIEDIPFNKELLNKEHKIVYVGVLEKSDYQPKYVVYDQSEIGLSAAEIFLILISIVFFALSGLVGYLSYRNCLRIKYGTLENKIKSEQLQSLLS